MDDFTERYLDEDRKLKSKIRISRLQVLIEDQLSIENGMSIIEMGRSEIRKIEKPKIQNRPTGVPSPLITLVAVKIFELFYHPF